MANMVEGDFSEGGRFQYFAVEGLEAGEVGHRHHGHIEASIAEGGRLLEHAGIAAERSGRENENDGCGCHDSKDVLQTHGGRLQRPAGFAAGRLESGAVVPREDQAGDGVERAHDAGIVPASASLKQPRLAQGAA